MKTIRVQVQKDHLERLAVNRSPVTAVAELIWNALDADANQVDVSFEYDFSGGIAGVVVSDDGTGITPQDAEHGFANLGGSWKRVNSLTRRDRRRVHGKEGKGRFHAYSLGSEVEWETRYERMGVVESLTIGGSVERLGTFTISDPAPAPGDSTGTTVRITGVHEQVNALAKVTAANALAEIFAMYLREYPAVRLKIGGLTVDPGQLEAHHAEYLLPPLEARGQTIEDAKLTIIEWTVRTSRQLYLCNREGFALHPLPVGVHAPGFNFTAYVSSSYLNQLAEDASYLVGELDPGISALVAAAKDRMREHFKQRKAEEAQDLVESWKKENIYPFKGEPADAVDRTTRQVFDIVALNVNQHLADFATADARTKQFSLRLIRQAIESNPESLQRIIGEVLDLPKSKQDELAGLLEKTSLSSIISAAKVVADRLNVLRALEVLVFHPESKQQLLERSQLHRIIADHTWLFGEEFHLSVDDESLTSVLRKHLKILGRTELAASVPVKRLDGKDGIVDLMLSREIERKAGEHEHLIIELKRPSKKIDGEVLMQVEQYAAAVANDERFRHTGTRWTFWAVSNEMDEYAKGRARQTGRPRGQISENEDPHRVIWAKTWGEIIDECRSRLNFFKERLSYAADSETALAHLRRTHGHYFPPVLLDDEAAA